MNWQEGVAIAVVLIGLGAGGRSSWRNGPPSGSSWGDGWEKILLPLAWRYVSKRMPPEEEAAWRAAERQGQGDEWLKGRRRRSIGR